MEEIVLNPVVTTEDPANITLYRIDKIKVMVGEQEVEGKIKRQQGVYSKADLLFIKNEIEKILNPPA